MAKTAASANEIRLTRVYDAPVEAVWDAWTQEDKAAKWWGPRGFSITTHSKDFRPGGHWKYTMHGPGGQDFPNLQTYIEIERHKKMVYDQGATEKSPPMFRVTVLLSDLGGKTKLDMTMTLPTAEAAADTRQIIKKFSGDSTWDRLAEQLEKDATGREVFVITRAFDCPVEKMFELWTDPKHLALWLAPKGATMRFIRADVRPGGSSFYTMSHPGGNMYGRVEYVELVKPSRLVYKQQFCDKTERLARHPMSPTWPETMLTTVRFEAEGPDRARARVEWAPDKPAPAELDTFVKARAGMTGGWTGSLDKLEDYIKEAR